MRRRFTNGRRPVGRTGFTLMEMLLALAVSSMIAITVVMMLAGLASATQEKTDVRRATVKRQVAIVRLGRLLRGAAMVLANGDDHIVLWKGDTRNNGRPDLSELLRVEYDPGAHEVSTYEGMVPLDPASDPTYKLADDFSALTASLAGTSAFPRTVTLQAVTSWDLELDNLLVQSARMMRLGLAIGSESGEDEAIIISTLRASPG